MYIFVQIIERIDRLWLKMVDTQNVWVSADHGHYFHPFINHMTKLRNFTKDEICEFLALAFSLQLMFDQTLINLIVCLMISQQIHTIVAQTNEHGAVYTG